MQLKQFAFLFSPGTSEDTEMKSSNSKSKIAVLGLGNLGSAIVKTLYAQQFSVVVWNRTTELSAKLFSGAGFGGRLEIAKTLERATGQAEVIFVCVSGFDALISIIESFDRQNHLDGKILLQFTTLDSEQAEYVSNWANKRGLKLVECSLLGIPMDVANRTATVLCSGATYIYDQASEYLDALGTSEHVSEKAGAIYEFDKSYYCFAYSLLIGYVQGAALAKASGYPVETYSRIVATRMPYFVDKIESLSREIISRDFKTNEATIDVWAAAFHHTLAQCDKAGVHAALPATLAQMMQDAIEDGHGDQAISALAEILSPGSTIK